MPYPPGVTGQESTFNSHVEYLMMDCPECEMTYDNVSVTENRTGNIVQEYWECPECGSEHENEYEDVPEDQFDDCDWEKI